MQATGLLNFPKTLHVHLEELDIAVFASGSECGAIGTECSFHDVCGMITYFNHATATLQQGIGYL